MFKYLEEVEVLMSLISEYEMNVLTENKSSIL